MSMPNFGPNPKATLAGVTFAAKLREALKNPINRNPATGFANRSAAVNQTKQYGWTDPAIRNEYINANNHADRYARNKANEFFQHEHRTVFGALEAAGQEYNDLLNTNGSVTQSEEDAILQKHLDPVGERMCLVEPPPVRDKNGTLKTPPGPYPSKEFKKLCPVSYDGNDSEFRRFVVTRTNSVGHDLSNLTSANWIQSEALARNPSRGATLQSIFGLK